MEWSNWNFINLFFVFFSTYLAIDCWKDGRDFWGHFNALSAVLNGWVVASRLGF